jgi:hypothetical protein
VTSRLEEAFAEAAKLAPQEQDALAAWLLEELASERRWTASFAGTADQLGQLADEALAEHRAGRTQPLDPDLL